MSQVIGLPEVSPLGHPNVECKIHSGLARPAYAVCAHVLAGAAVMLRAEPDRDAWGCLLCAECFTTGGGELPLALACEKCVEYHFHRSECEEGQHNMPELMELTNCEREGMAAFRGQNRTRGVAKCLYPDGSLKRFAWNLGFRLAQYLAEERERQ